MFQYKVFRAILFFTAYLSFGLFALSIYEWIQPGPYTGTQYYKSIAPLSFFIQINYYLIGMAALLLSGIGIRFTQVVIFLLGFILLSYRGVERLMEIPPNTYQRTSDGVQEWHFQDKPRYLITIAITITVMVIAILPLIKNYNYNKIVNLIKSLAVYRRNISNPLNKRLFNISAKTLVAIIAGNIALVFATFISIFLVTPWISQQASFDISGKLWSTSLVITLYSVSLNLAAILIAIPLFQIAKRVNSLWIMGIMGAIFGIIWNCFFYAINSLLYNSQQTFNIYNYYEPAVSGAFIFATFFVVYSLMIDLIKTLNSSNHENLTLVCNQEESCFVMNSG